VPAYREAIASELASSADPLQAELGIARLVESAPGTLERLREGGPLLHTVVTVMAASPFLTRALVTDPLAIEVLSALEHPVGELTPLSRWKALEVLRIAALDLSGEIPLETVGASLADLADGLLRTAATASGLSEELAVIAMGKLGARELNYGSDIDVVLVGGGDPQPLVSLVRQAWRTDLGLRPEGRSGPLVRSLASYIAYWDRWAQTWEFQALLKARPAAGSAELGDAFSEEAAKRVWGRPLGTDDLRALRAMKARAEKEVARQGLPNAR
jgi:[glutamine synthetase] adenylyltransferase / [glutamine synthetase]-adenylyl-L-tyrosine phosphorylase